MSISGIILLLIEPLNVYSYSFIMSFLITFIIIISKKKNIFHSFSSFVKLKKHVLIIPIIHSTFIVCKHTITNITYSFKGNNLNLIILNTTICNLQHKYHTKNKTKIFLNNSNCGINC